MSRSPKALLLAALSAVAIVVGGALVAQSQKPAPAKPAPATVYDHIRRACPMATPSR